MAASIRRRKVPARVTSTLHGVPLAGFQRKDLYEAVPQSPGTVAVVNSTILAPGRISGQRRLYSPRAGLVSVCGPPPTSGTQHS